MTGDQLNILRMEWQNQGTWDEWVFGLMVRGVVRNPVAEIYFNEEIPDPTPGGWVWFLHGTEDGKQIRGVAASFRFAVQEVEKALGID